MHAHFKEVLDLPKKVLYETVVQVERYPDFLPWCHRASVVQKTPRMIIADITIGVSCARESYRSKVHLFPYDEVNVEYISGPFKYLKNFWKFTSLTKSTTQVEFFIDLELQSVALQKMLDIFFPLAVSRLSSSFIRQARTNMCGQAKQ